jgi:hypothetical protein
MSADGKRLNNGALYTVQGFTRSGDIVTNTGAVIGRDYRHLALGYVVTSHASQGKSVKEVFIAQSSMSGPASNLAQFYVSASRGEKKATVYTDDKAALLEAVSRVDERLSATEFVAMRTLRDRTTALQRVMNAAGRIIPSLRRLDRNREEPARDR